jgi:hypothetical protein
MTYSLRQLKPIRVSSTSIRSKSCTTETTTTLWFNETSGQNQTDISTWSNCSPLTEEQKLALGLGLGLGLGIPLLIILCFFLYRRHRNARWDQQNQRPLRQLPDVPRIVQAAEQQYSFQTAFSPEAFQNYNSGLLTEILMLELMIERVRRGKDLTEIQQDAIEKGHDLIAQYVQNMNIVAFPPIVFEMAKQ